MATDSTATPPDGLWKGLAVNRTGFFQVELRLKFSEGQVNGTYTFHTDDEKKRGQLSGTVNGSRISFTETGDYGTFKGRVEDIGSDTWMMFGKLSGSDGVGSLTVFRSLKTLKPSGGVWDGSAFKKK